ncbi:dockerin type I repeat-containing protein [Ruminococcus sp.]|uniref:dockerin type I repeat-containing protein n=1 Tax=Ruminococcus sp. TaxID=41978 RepID=UPI0025E66E22|nr:dockerin type I repeat-containing protein [Ruminococcus sp.]
MKPIKLMAALTALMLAAANTAAIQPNLTTKAEQGVAADAEQGTCTLNVSVIDITTEEAIPDIKATLLLNPTGTSSTVEEWTTTDKVKTISGLFAKSDYGVALKDPSGKYDCKDRIYFSIDEENKTFDLKIRVVPKDAKENTRISAYDWTNLETDPEKYLYEGSRDMSENEYSLAAYNDKDELINRGVGSIYLPDGTYKLVVTPIDEDLVLVDTTGKKAADVFKMFGDDFDIPKSNTISITVSGGRVVGEPAIYFEKEAEDPAADCTLNVSVIDISTGKAIPDIKASLILNPTGTGSTVEEWTTTDGVKTISGLYAKASYCVALKDISGKYDCKDRIYFSIDEENKTFDLKIRAVPKDAKENTRISAYDWTNLETDPEKHLYEGSRVMSENEYSLAAYNDKDELINKGVGSIYLPDGTYKLVVTPIDEDLVLVDTTGKKAADVFKMFGDDFDIPKSNTISITVSDGRVVGEPSIYFEKRADAPTADCTVNVSVVDSESGEAIPGIEAVLIASPNATGYEITRWITSDQVKTVSDLYSSPIYEVILRNVPEEYAHENAYLFSFEKANDTVELAIKLTPKDSVKNVRVIAYDWTDLVVDPAQGLCTGETAIPENDYTIKFYDEEKGLIKEGKGPVFLPNGHYIAAVFTDDEDYTPVPGSSDKVKKYKEMYPSAEIPPYNTVRFSVLGGKLSGTPAVYFTRQSAVGNKSITVNIVDAETNNAIDDIGFQIYSISDELAEKAENTAKYINDVAINGKLKAVGNMKDNIITGLKADQKYAVLIDNYNTGYTSQSPDVVIVDFSKDDLSQEVTFKLKKEESPSEWNTAIHLGLVTSVDAAGEPIYDPMPVDCEILVFKNDGDLYGRYNTSDSLYLALPVGDYDITVENPDSTKYDYYKGDKYAVSLKKDSLETVMVYFELLNKEVVYGDANCDGNVELADAILIMQSLANPDKYGTDGSEKNHITQKGRINADVNGSGTMTAEDALTIQRYLLRQIKNLPDLPATNK